AIVILNARDGSGESWSVRVYGANTPALTGAITGVQNDDGITASFSTIATSRSPVGSYAIVPSLADPSNKLNNYSVSLTNGALTVTKSALIVSADNKTRIYGAANPPLTGAIDGVQNGDNITPSYGTPATASSNVGGYPIVA